MYRAHPTDGIAWVTGASSGIGREVALELARRGYTVAVTARRVDELQALAAQSPNIFAFPGDTTDRAAIAGIVAEIEAAHGPIALAFLNAGVYFVAERDRFSADLIRRTFEINSTGPSIASIRSSWRWNGVVKARSRSPPPWPAMAALRGPALMVRPRRP